MRHAVNPWIGAPDLGYAQPEGLLQFKSSVLPGTTATPFAFRLEGSR
jgi:hypothetical protein